MKKSTKTNRRPLLGTLACEPEIRNDWTVEEAARLFRQPMNDLLFLAQQSHRRYFDPNEIQLSTLLNVKSGGCPEDCAYCPQSARYATEVVAQPLMDKTAVVEAAERARARGATRFCMGAAWRELRDKDLPKIADLIRSVKATGLETCVTLGMLSADQAHRLAAAGLDFYNHNLDTSESYYGQIISTRTYQDRLTTLQHVREAGIRVCCGGIIGMGERLSERCEFLVALSNLPQHPESVPINVLVRVPGTPLADAPDVDPFDVVRTIAVARILMPASYLRLSAGRSEMSDTQQALCFMAGANSIFYGDKLLTTDNPGFDEDQALFERLGLRVKT